MKQRLFRKKRKLMKKLNLLFIPFALLLFCINNVAAQTFNIEQFKFGLEVSPTISWMGTNDRKIDGNGSNLGLKLSTHAEFNLSERYALTSGIGFFFNAGGTLLSQYPGTYFNGSINAGEPFAAPTTNGDIRVKYSIQYVEIPIAFKLKSNEFGYFTYYVEAPIFTLAINTGSKGTLSGGGIEKNEKISIYKEVNPIAISWGLGGGVEYAVSSSTKLFGGLTYQRVFSDITRDGDYNYQGRQEKSDPYAFLNSISLKFGVLF